MGQSSGARASTGIRYQLKGSTGIRCLPSGGSFSWRSTGIRCLPSSCSCTYAKRQGSAPSTKGVSTNEGSASRSFTSTIRNSTATTAVSSATWVDRAVAARGVRQAASCTAYGQPCATSAAILPSTRVGRATAC